MPDDILEVTEQAPDVPADEGVAFAEKDEEVIDNAEPSETLDVEDEPKSVEKEIEEPTEKSKEIEETEDVEEDEDTLRGKELLEEEERLAAEQRAAYQAARVQPQEGYNPFSEANTDSDIEFFRTVIPPKLLPDTAKLKDGTELNFGSIIESEPEIPVMIAVIANNLIRQMIANKYIATHEDLNGTKQTFDNQLFIRTVTNEANGVPDAPRIARDPKFQEWLAKQPKEIQVLRKSRNPKDHIRMFKRYLNNAGLEKAKATVKDIDDKRKEKKKTFDAIHKTTVKSKGKPGETAQSARDEELAGFNSNDDDI